MDQDIKVFKLTEDDSNTWSGTYKFSTGESLLEPTLSFDSDEDSLYPISVDVSGCDDISIIKTFNTEHEAKIEFADLISRKYVNFEDLFSSGYSHY